MDHLFAYGTLMCDDIMEEVSGFRLSRIPGALMGYSRRCVKGEVYPALFLNVGGRVDGVVYRDVPASAWVRLDRFEGEMYARQHVQIEINEGATLAAVTYVFRAEFLDRLDESEWDFDNFLRNGKASFQRHYLGYQSLKSNQ